MEVKDCFILPPSYILLHMPPHRYVLFLSNSYCYNAVIRDAALENLQEDCKGVMMMTAVATMLILTFVDHPTAQTAPQFVTTTHMARTQWVNCLRKWSPTRQSLLLHSNCCRSQANVNRNVIMPLGLDDFEMCITHVEIMCKVLQLWNKSNTEWLNIMNFH